ncbi:hypothetical protein H6F89_04265 [Cyanobacteria bacterium FACHB-63]|nr:hypothetical protein [Cyanobacteria bacterium FACHB-63]
MKFNRSTLNVISIFCFLATLLMSCWFSNAIAAPVQVAQTQTLTEFPEGFYSYLDKKYTIYLGENRGACAYSIDPTEGYEQGNNRFVTARIRQGWSGNACRGVIAFRVLQADCQANKFYEIDREEGPREPGASGPTQYRWRQFEMSLTEYKSEGFGVIRRNTSEDLASKVCSLPVKSTATES